MTKKLTLTILAIILSGVCALVYKAEAKQIIKNTIYEVERVDYVTKYYDENANTVCYLTGISGISCVKL